MKLPNATKRFGLLTGLAGEFETIDRIKHIVGKPSRRVHIGIGDDAAVTDSPEGKLIATVDMMVEGVHFNLVHSTPFELGHKALAVNLSDIAAMGAQPLYALVSLGLRQDLSATFIDELYHGIKKLAKKYQTDIVGGNIVQSPTALLVDITVVGHAKKDYATRSGAEVGDIIAVTGHLGSSSAGLNLLRLLGRKAIERHEKLIRAHVAPEPRIQESAALMKSGSVTSMIDISDGLASEIHHIVKASDVGALIDEKRIPVSRDVNEVATMLGLNAMDWGLYGGEDYELVVTLKRQQLKRVQKLMQNFQHPFSVIGEIKPREFGVQILSSEGKTKELEPKGWRHF